MKQYRIIFFGAGDFAVPSLKALVADGRFNVTAIVTQPDRPVGRHAALTPPPVKVTAATLNIMDVRQPEKLADPSFQKWVKEVGQSCDAFIVVSYGKILPQWLLELPKKGVLNVHGSLLPRHRGASPIQTAIAAGDDKSGVTVMKLDAEMDHGPILTTAATGIRTDDTGASLHDRLASLGAKILPQTLIDYLDGRITPVEQKNSQATYSKILTREDGKIDWSRPAEEIEHQIRAFNPWPGTWTLAGHQRLKILKAAVIWGDETYKSGQCFIFEKRPAVACGEGTALELLTVRPEGKSSMSGTAFLSGRNDWSNIRLV